MATDLAVGTAPRRGVAVIADDLTGALDAAAPFSAHGFWTQVIPSFALDTGAGVDADVRVFCSDTRDSVPAVAATNRERCIDSALGSSAEVLGLKIDSLLRGSIADDLRAVVSRLNTPGPIFLAPAFPGQSRVTRNSQVLVDGVELSGTESYRQQEAPSLRGIAEQTGLPVRVVGLEELRSEQFVAGLRDEVGGRVVIVAFDAEVDADLAQIVDLGVEIPVALWVGSAGLFHHLAAQILSRGQLQRSQTSRPDLLTPLPNRTPRILVVSGSASATATAQLEALVESGAAAQYAGDPGDVSRVIRALRGALATGDVAAIGVPRPTDDVLTLDPKHARVIAAVVAELRAFIDGLVVVGGETSRQSFKQLGVRTLHVTASLDGGMAAGFAEPGLTAPTGAFPFVSKAGAFGDDKALIRAVAHLQSQLKGAQ